MHDAPSTVISSSPALDRRWLAEIWEFRELLYFLTWRDIKVRYKQTALGIAWALLQPLMTTLIFWLFLNRMGRIPSDGLPYPLFSYTAMLPWSYISNSLAHASSSLMTNSHLVCKIYFPRIILPLSSVLSAMVDFLVAFCLLLVMLAFYRIHPSLERLLALPLLLLLTAATAFGAGAWLSALGARYRDVRFLVPFLIQTLLFVTPVIYPSSMIKPPWRLLYGMNPMLAPIEGFRWCLLGTAPPAEMLACSISVSMAVLLCGCFYFRGIERSLADTL